MTVNCFHNYDMQFACNHCSNSILAYIHHTKQFSMNSCILTPSEERRKAFCKALHSDTARSQLQWHVCVCMTAVSQSETRIVISVTNERPGMTTLVTHRTHAQLSITPVHLNWEREERGCCVIDICALLIIISEPEGICSRLFPVGVTVLLILLINRRGTWCRLSLFESITRQITSLELCSLWTQVGHSITLERADKMT